MHGPETTVRVEVVMVGEKHDALAVPGSSALTSAAPPARPRRKGPAQKTVVQRVVDEQSGVGVDVVFDAASGGFRASVPGFPQEILGTEAGPVVQRVREILRATREYQWQPTIVVDAGGAGNFWDRDTAPEVMHETQHSNGLCEYVVRDVTLAVRFYRLEVAPKPGDPTSFVCRPHVLDVEADDCANLKSGPRRDYATRARVAGQDVGDFLERDRAVVLPYTPALWAAVNQAASDVLAVGERLRALLAKPDALAAVGARLLAAGDASSAPLLSAPIVPTRNYKVVCQKWEESERGWGTRPDGYSLHLSEDARKAYLKAYQDKLPDEVPDEYSRPDGMPYEVDVDAETYAKIEAARDRFGVMLDGRPPGNEGVNGWRTVKP